MLRNTSITSIVATVKTSGTAVVCAFGFRHAAGASGAAGVLSGNNKSEINKIVTLDNPALLTGII